MKCQMKRIERSRCIIDEFNGSIERCVEICALQLFRMIVGGLMTVAGHIFQNITRFTADWRN